MTHTERTIFETEYWRVELNTNDQTYLGRSFVTAKRDVGSMSELTQAEWLDFSLVVKQFELVCKKAFGATMFNWTCLMNLAYQNNPPNPQVHWHVRPRYVQPVTFAGETFIDERFGHHYLQKTERVVSDEMAKEIIVEMQKVMHDR